MVQGVKAGLKRLIRYAFVRLAARKPDESEELKRKLDALKRRDAHTTKAFAAINDVVNRYQYGQKSTPETKEFAQAIQEAWRRELKGSPEC